LGLGGNADEPLQFRAVAFGALRLFIAKDEGFEVVLAFLAGVFKKGHRLFS